MNFNSCTFMGRLTNDAEFIETKTNKSMAKFRIAVNNRRSNDTLYINVLCFGKVAENLYPKLKKGLPVLVEGSLQRDEWETRGGEKRTDVTVFANTVEIDHDFFKKEETDSE